MDYSRLRKFFFVLTVESSSKFPWLTFILKAMLFVNFYTLGDVLKSELTGTF